MTHSKWNLRGTADLQRTLLSFNGLSDGTRKVKVVTGTERYGTHRLKVHQTDSVLTITVPQLPVSVEADVVDSIASAAYERVAGFLHSSDMVRDLAERSLVTEDNVSPLAMITETFEGLRASREFGNYLPGTRSALANRQAERVTGLKEVAKEITKEQGAGYVACELLASTLIDKWAPSLIEAEVSVLKNGNPSQDVVDACAELMRSGIIDELHEADSYEDTRELAGRAFKLLFDKDPEQEEQDCQQQQQEEGDGGDEGEGEGDEQGGDDQEQEGDESKPKSSKPTEVSDELKDARERQCSQEHSEEETEVGEPARGHDGDGDYIPTPDAEVVWSDFTSGESSESRFAGHNTLYHRIREDAAASGLTNTLRRVVQVRSQAHWVGAQKKGRLQRKNLYRAAVDTVGSGEWNAKIRRRREQAATLDTSVCLLVDYSGSMSGARIEVAMGAAMYMSKALNSLGIKFSVEGFSTQKSSHNHYLFKRYEQAYNEPKLRRALLLGTHNLNQNEDYKGIDLASRSLLQQRTKRKIMIVLSDGSPACYRPGMQGPAMRQLMKENSKYIDYVGIGIQDSSVEEYYTESSVIEDLSDLTPAILSTLKSKLV